jgi:hypothetical protein
MRWSTKPLTLSGSGPAFHRPHETTQRGPVVAVMKALHGHRRREPFVRVMLVAQLRRVAGRQFHGKGV